VLLAVATWSPALAIAIAVPLVLVAMGMGLYRATRLTVAEIAVIYLIVAVLIALLLPAVQSHPRTSNNNIKQLVLALHNYHEIHGSFPPQYVADANGQPLYSWRVLILPFIEEQRLYDEFHLDEAWDSPHNVALADQMPAIFRSPYRPGRTGSVTNYVGVSSPETAWRGEQALRFADFTDGAANTLLLVEWCESDVAWSEPRDLPLPAATKCWLPATVTPPGQDGFVVGYGDGSVHWLVPRNLPVSELRGLLTPAGGEPVPLRP
jgi:hypothetical protein